MIGFKARSSSDSACAITYGGYILTRTCQWGRFDAEVMGMNGDVK